MKGFKQFLLSLLIPASLFAQDEQKKIELNGYLTGMQTIMFEDIQDEWISENLFHNRLNLYLYPVKNLSASLQLRSRLIYGDMIESGTEYIDALDKDGGWLDLSFNLFSGESYALNSTIDRIWIQYTAGNFVGTAGRQRINWGQSRVWNPNDLFNVYSYFDVDYTERPGSDAIRLQYYPGYTSTIELAAKIDSSNKVTAAGLFRFNMLGYDLQFLGGVLGEKDYVAGLGWSGNIRNAGFRGEFSYFHDIENFSDTSGVIIFSCGLDYTFTNAFMLQFEFLYSNKSNMPPGGFLGYYDAPMNVKSLAFTEYSLFAAAAYPITPLLQANMAGMYFPDLKGAFVGPSLSYNMLKNLDLSLFIQYFSAELEHPFTLEKQRQNILLTFLRLKWNF
jgi:hypothetical protein